MCVNALVGNHCRCALSVHFLDLNNNTINNPLVCARAERLSERWRIGRRLIVNGVGGYGHRPIVIVQDFPVGCNGRPTDGFNGETSYLRMTNY